VVPVRSGLNEKLDTVSGLCPIPRLVQRADDLSAELIECSDAGGTRLRELGSVVEGSPEERSVGEDGADVCKGMGKTTGIPRESFGREFAVRVLTGEFVEGGEVTEVPETGGEFDEVGMGAFEGVEEREDDVGQAVVDGDCVVRVG
jgi:hypothetical protein